MHCKRCKNKISQYAKKCPYCQAPVQSDHRAIRRYMKMLTENVNVPSDSNKKHEKKIGLAVLSVVLTVSILLMSYKEKRSQWQVTGQTVFYMQKDTLIAKDLTTGEKRKVSDLSKEKAEEKKVSCAQEQAFYCDSEKGIVYFAQNIHINEEHMQYDIYQRKTKKWAMAATAIARKVRLHSWSDNGVLYYATGDGRRLYVYQQGKTTTLAIPLVKEMHKIAGSNRILVIGYEPRGDSKGYDYTTYNETDGLIFYIIDMENNTPKQILNQHVESYAYTKDATHLYYQLDNILYDYDLLACQEVVFEKNVYEFLLINEENEEKLYYIQYDVVEKPLYEFVKDSYSKQDEKLRKSKELLKKEDAKERECRLSREEFRKQLKQQKVCLFQGTLYEFKDGNVKTIGNHVVMLDSLYRSMIHYEPFVYMEREIDFGDYHLKKEGIEDVRTVYDMVVNLVDGQMRNYDINYESLYVYKGKEETMERRQVLMCCKDIPYKVKNGTLEKYDSEDSEDETSRSLVSKQQNSVYYISWYHENALYREQNGISKELLQSVEAYQLLGNGKVLALSTDEKDGKNTLYQIDQKGTKRVVDTGVTAILGGQVYSQMGYE